MHMYLEPDSDSLLNQNRFRSGTTMLFLAQAESAQAFSGITLSLLVQGSPSLAVSIYCVL